MTAIFDNPLRIEGANDLTPDIAEDPDKFRAWQRKARTAGAEQISHDTPEMHEAWVRELDVEPAGQTKARELLTRFEWLDKDPRGVLLYGRPGRGKSHLAGATTLRLRDLGEPVVWIAAARMLDQMRDLFRDDAPGATISRYRDRLERARWLVIDDLGAERPTDFAAEQLCMLLDARFDNRRSCKTLVTTNLSANELHERLGARATSRLFGLCRDGLCEIGGPDLRQSVEVPQ